MMRKTLLLLGLVVCSFAISQVQNFGPAGSIMGTSCSSGSCPIQPQTAPTVSGTLKAASFNATNVNAILQANGSYVLAAPGESTFVGYGNAAALTSGALDTVVGANSAANLTSGSYDVLMGYGAGNGLTTGNYSVFIGYDAGLGASTANYNILIGYNAGSNVSTGSSNTSIGTQSGQNIGATNSNTYIGATAGYVSTGGNNTAIGAGSMNASGTTGGSETCVGNLSCSGGMTGSFETCIGTSSCTGAMSSSGNVAVGYEAATKITSGQDNVIIGTQAGNTTQATGTGNILIGYETDTPLSYTNYEINIGGALIGYAISPALGSGWGTSPTGPTQSSTFSFSFTVGATGTPSTTGNIGLATAPNGWSCILRDQTSNITSRETAQTTTGVTVTWSAAPSNSDVILGNCFAY